MCECLRQAPDGRLPLSALGSSFSTLSKRRGLHGNLQNLSQAVKTQWGSWEAFVRARAADGLRLEDGTVSLVRAIEPAGQMRSDDEDKQPARLAVAAAVPSRDDVNNLSLDGL